MSRVGKMPVVLPQGVEVTIAADKISVKGADAHPLYASLAQASGQAPRWNFHKYLVDRQGRVVASFASDVVPEDKRITVMVEQLLAQR